MVVKGNDPQSGVRCLAQSSRRSLQSVGVDRAALLTPWAHRVQSHDDEPVRLPNRLRRSEDALPLCKGSRKACREGVGDVVVPGHGEIRDAEAFEDLARPFELRAAPAVGQIACSEQEVRLHLRHQLLQGSMRFVCVASADVQVGDVEDACGHRRGRLYTRVVVDESPELFDDIYLGLRAGGAARKQRRGEPLSVEEEEAIGRWQRLSLWRRFIAIGAFALGTFGLGLTVGGLIFGRWRAARR